MITHEREFQDPPADEGKAARDEIGDGLARDYAQTFLEGRGRRVLDDLRAKFSPRRLRYKAGRSTEEGIWIDGQCSVLVEIEDAIKRGAPKTGDALLQTETTE